MSEGTRVTRRRDPAAMAASSWVTIHLLRNPFFWATLVALAAIPALIALYRRGPEPLPVLGTLPAFRLVDQQGRPFGSADLRGQVWVGNFIFTSCPSICPGLTRAMRSLQERYQAGRVPVRLVSFSVDPENDSPAVLRAYARRFGADLSTWTFVTGPEAAVRSLIVDGFKTYLGRRERRSDNLVDIAHAAHFVLVDGAGRIRGYYRPDPGGLDEIFRGSRRLLLEDR